MEEPHRRRTFATMKPQLPADILLSNILPRLPAKSVSRFKCVSKQWNSFLSTPSFSKMHLHHLTNDNHHDHHKFLFFSSATTPTNFQTLECEAPDHDSGLTVAVTDTVSRSLPFKVGYRKMLTFITSFNGLVCIGITDHEVSSYVYSDMILWNPCTRDYNTLSKANSYKECYKVTGIASALYYNASEDDYRLLRVTKHLSVYIYSLKSDSWKEVDSDLQQIGTSSSETWGQSILQNEKLCFLDKGDRGTDQLSYSVIRFDTRTENFTEIATPGFGDVKVLNCMLLHKDQKIHLCMIYNSSGEEIFTELGAKLWRMDDGDGEWTKVAAYQIPGNFYCYEPHHLMRNGNWLTFCRAACHVHEIDPDKDFKKISHRRIDNAPKGKYIETLVSPNLYR